MQVSGRVEDIVLAISGAAAADSQMAHGVEGEVARADAFPGGLSAEMEPKGDGQSILEQFFGVIGTDPRNVFGDCLPEPGCNFAKEETFSVGTHWWERSEEG